MNIFGNRRGSGCVLGTQNIDFPAGKCTFLTGHVVGNKNGLAGLFDGLGRGYY